MVGTFNWVKAKLALLMVLSSVLLWAPLTAEAHELQPTIGDLSVQEGVATLILKVNLEALLSGIDLDAIADTNNAANAQDYDALRTLSVDEIAARAPNLLIQWNALPLLKINGDGVPLSSAQITMPEGVDPELARISQWELTADLPRSATEVVVSWPKGAGAMVLRQQGVEAPFTGYLNGGDSSPAISFEGGGAQSGWQAFGSYIPVGFDHILPQGLDHILFVLGLFLLSTHLAPLLWQVSAFTLAHTVTLALGALGLVNIPGAIVEPLIAASIVYVAVENIFRTGLSRWRPLVIFGFGLLHGLGFASVLGDFGLPQDQFVPALIGFNVGVEVGQLTVIALAAILLWIAVGAARIAPLKGVEEEVREHDVMFRAASIVGSLVIAIIGIFWVIERTLL